MRIIAFRGLYIGRGARRLCRVVILFSSDGPQHQVLAVYRENGSFLLPRWTGFISCVRVGGIFGPAQSWGLPVYGIWHILNQGA